MKWLDAKKAGSKRNNKRTPLQAQEGKADKGHLVDVESAGEEGGGEGERRVTERELVGFFSGREEDMSTDDLDSGSEMTEKLKVEKENPIFLATYNCTLIFSGIFGFSLFTSVSVTQPVLHSIGPILFSYWLFAHFTHTTFHACEQSVAGVAFVCHKIHAPNFDIPFFIWNLHF